MNGSVNLNGLSAFRSRLYVINSHETPFCHLSIRYPLKVKCHLGESVNITTLTFVELVIQFYSKLFFFHCHLIIPQINAFKSSSCNIIGAFSHQ